MSKLQVKHTTHAPANSIYRQTASLKFKSGDHEELVEFYSTNPKNVKIMTSDTVAKGVVLITNDAVMISPATQLTYFLNGSIGHFSGDKFCVCVEGCTATVYNMPERIEFVQDYSGIVSYGFFPSGVAFIKAELNSTYFTLDVNGTQWKIDRVYATVNEEGQNLLDLERQKQDLKKIMDSPVTGLKPISVVPVNPIVEPIVDVIIDDGSDDDEDPYAEIYREIVPKEKPKKMWKEPKEPIDDIRDIIQYLDEGLDM